MQYCNNFPPVGYVFRAMKRLKFVVIGAVGVGRTTLMENYIIGGAGQPGNSRPRSFMQCDTSSYVINVIVDGLPYSLKLFDPDSDGTLEDLQNLLLTELPDAVIVMYDISNSESFRSVEFLFRSVRSILPKIKCVLCGNKSDLRIRNPSNLPLVTENEGRKLSQRLRMRYFIETSGLGLRNVAELLDETVRLAVPALSEFNFRMKSRRREKCPIM